jgi:hypothetical protein
VEGGLDASRGANVKFGSVVEGRESRCGVRIEGRKFEFWESAAGAS